MKKCVIFCAGEFDALLEGVGPGDLVIAADAGVRHTQALGLTPDVVLGDFDSLGFTPAGAQVFPVEKDDTDAMLAVRYGLAAGCREFHIYGGLDGPRLDHTVANFQILDYIAWQGAFGYLIGKTWIATVVREGALTFPAGAEGIVSVFCLGADAAGVTERGLHYGLEEGTLTAGFPLGACNHFIGQEAAIQVRQGSLLVLWQRDGVKGLPRRGGSEWTVDS